MQGAIIPPKKCELCANERQRKGAHPANPFPVTTNHNSLTMIFAISPLDGRYSASVSELSPFFSEFALMRYRVRVEAEYFIALCRLPLPALHGVDPSVFDRLKDLYEQFSEADALRIKEIERKVNHDVKAVEYLLKEKMEDNLGLGM